MTENSGKTPIQIALTPEQQERLRQQSGREVTALKLRLEELEVRLAPAYGKPGVKITTKGFG